MDILRNLPQGAVFTDRRGQATVAAEIRDSIIYITASCDSLQHLVYTYERELARIRDETFTETKEGKPPDASRMRWFTVGFATCLCLGLLILKLKIK